MSLKNEFPIFSKYPNLVYLDSAATAQKPQKVIDRLSQFYREENSNIHRGIYKLSEKATKEYADSREIVSEFINAKSSKEIIFTYGTTDGVNTVANSLNLIDNTVLTTQMEHHSNFIPWQQRAKKSEGTQLVLVNVKEDFTIDLNDLREKLQKYKPKLLTLTHVSNVLGTINPIKEIVDIKNQVSPETLIFLDSAQSIVHIPIDVQDLGIDFMVFSGHKLYGPTGIGVLWAREEILENQLEPLRYGGGMITDVEVEDSKWEDLPNRFEAGTPNISGAVGLGEAVKFITNIGFDKIQAEEKNITEYALEQLMKVNQIKIQGPTKSEMRTGVISITIDGIHPHDIAQILDGNDIAVRAGHHCNQILMKYVLKTPATTRISLGVYNDKSDIDKLIDALRVVIATFKR